MKTIVVNGSTGWMGKSTIQAALEDPVEEYNFQLFSRSKMPIEIKGKSFTPATRADAFSMAWETYVQAAFLTREKAGTNPSRYQDINRKIIQTAREDIIVGRPRSIVFFSSGILAHREVNGRDSSYQSYALLKQEERDVIYEAADAVGATLVEAKLYSATGTHMTAPRSFAIGALLSEAATGSVQIQSSRNVWRRYLDSVQYLKVLFAQSKSGESAVIESGGHLIELGELASRCLQLKGHDPQAVFRPEQSEPDDKYYSKSYRFEEMLMRLGDVPMTLADQLVNVEKALRARQD